MQPFSIFFSFQYFSHLNKPKAKKVMLYKLQTKYEMYFSADWSRGLNAYNFCLLIRLASGKIIYIFLLQHCRSR